MAYKRTGYIPDSSRRVGLAVGALITLTSLFVLFQPTAEGFPPSDNSERFSKGIPSVRGTPSPQGTPRTPTTESFSVTRQRVQGYLFPSLEPTITPTPEASAVPTGQPRETRAPTNVGSRTRTTRRIRPPPPVLRGARLFGRASWYCLSGVSACVHGRPGGMYAAAGPKLRVAMGGTTSAIGPQPWRGKRVSVCITGTRHCVRVTLIDWCQCSWKRPGEKVIDLYGDAMRALTRDFRSRGVLPVTVYTR